MIKLRHDDGVKYELRHRFVYECFNELVDGSTHHIDHIDANVANNTLANLQMLTISEHVKKTMTTTDSARPAKRKAVERFLKTSDGDATEVVVYESVTAAVAAMGISHKSGHAHIREVIRGMRKKAYGYFWRYLAHEDLPGEVWCSLRDPMYYRISVSNMGRIQLTTGIITFGVKKNTGYFLVGVGRKRYSVHRLVALAFHGLPPPDHDSVDHIDRDPTNNRSTNLRWATAIMQATNSCAKAIVAHDKDGVLVGRWESVAAAARELGIQPTNISKCISGVRKTTGGFIWVLDA